MKPSTQKVLDVMKRDGHITRLVAMHMNIGCVRKAVSELRELGYGIRTDKRKDTDGTKYTRWVLESEPNVKLQGHTPDKVIVDELEDQLYQECYSRLSKLNKEEYEDIRRKAQELKPDLILGATYRFVAYVGDANFRRGDILKYTEDDGTHIPYFTRVSDGKVQAVYPQALELV